MAPATIAAVDYGARGSLRRARRPADSRAVAAFGPLQQVTGQDVMSGIERVIVDECLGHARGVLQQFLGRLGTCDLEAIFLAAEHPGIPDVDILGKLLDERTVLLTSDRVLHNRAITRGFRSFLARGQNGLTEHRLLDVCVRDNDLPAFRGAIRDSYVDRSGPELQSIRESLIGFLSEHQRKQFRTKRRRIRAHFGSADNIATAELTITQRRSAGRALGGYTLILRPRHGVRSLNPASESYFVDHAGQEAPLAATCWAMLHVCWLQLQRCPLTLYHLDRVAFGRSAALLAQPDAARGEVEGMAARLFSVMPQIKLMECVKGRFFERASEKMNQLASFKTNELVPADLGAMAAALCRSGQE